MLHPLPSPRETRAGWVYLIFQLVLLPTLLTQGNSMLPSPLSPAVLNFLFFLINFAAALLIFRHSLKRDWKTAGEKPGKQAVAVLGGFLCYLLCGYLFDLAARWFLPGFVNLNDQGIGFLAGSQLLLMAAGTILLVPLSEECFYRGLIFGSLLRKSRALAYLVSAAVFSLIHILGYLGAYSGPDLLFSFLQYLPAGLILAFAYEKSGTLFAPVFIHALVNLRGIWLMR